MTRIAVFPPRAVQRGIMAKQGLPAGHVPSERYFAASEHFAARGMKALARKMMRKGNDSLRVELLASTQRLKERHDNGG